MPTFATPDPISVNIELGVGDLRIVASDRADTVVDVQPSDPHNSSDVNAAEKTSVVYTNGELEVKAQKGWKRASFRGSSESIDVRIELPRGSKLRGSAGVANLRTSGTLGQCRYRMGGGDIAVEHIAGTTELTTGTGDIKVELIGGSATIKNANGDTWIGEVVDDCQVKTANGSIDIDQSHGATTAKTANGDIHLGEVSRGSVVAETACGKVDVAVRSGVPAWLDLRTGFGRVRNLLEAGDRPGPSEISVEVRVRSSFGDLTVRRAGMGDDQRGVA